MSATPVTTMNASTKAGEILLTRGDPVDLEAPVEARDGNTSQEHKRAISAESLRRAS